MLLASALAGCGLLDWGSAARGVAKPTVRIGSTNFGEQVILAELYGGALEAAGYRVERVLNLGSRETVEPALESGRIDLYAEYLATMVAFVSRGAQLGSPDPEATRAALQELLRPRGIAVLDHAPATDTNGFVVTRATADRFRLASLSDLAPLGPQLVLGGPPECPVRPFCLPGLRDTYGLVVKQFRPLDAGGPLTVAALESGQIDVGLLFTTSPQISSRGFVLLADDRGLQLADNVAPVVRSDLLAKAPPDFARALNEVSARLSTEALTGLNAAVEIGGRSPREAAQAWLRDQGLVRGTR